MDELDPEFKAMLDEDEGITKPTDKALESLDALKEAYKTAKTKGGKAFYDFIQQHKDDLVAAFDDDQGEKNLIVLVPSIGDEAVGSSDKKWVKEQNAGLKKSTDLKDVKIAAKEQSIKDVRERNRYDLASKAYAEQAKRIRAELEQKGYNPTDEDVKKVVNEMMKEQERVRRADAYEQKPAWQRIAFALTAPRTAESLSMGLRPTVKDNVLDLVELGSTFLPFGAIAKFPKLFNKIGKAATKLDELTQGVPFLGIAGDLAKGGGQIAVPEFLASAGVGTADAIAYDASWSSVKAAQIGTSEAITVYIRKEMNIPDIADYQVLNVRVKYAGGVVAYFNGRKVARFNLEEEFDADSESIDIHDSTVFSKFHITHACSEVLLSVFFCR